MSSTLLSAVSFLSMVDDPDLILLDATFGKEAYAEYTKSHIEGAQWINLNTQLSEIGPDPSLGGRHPLPSVESFAATLGTFGIDTNSKVVIYDRNNGALAAARCWWMLRAIGHEQTWVIDGGYQAVQAAGGNLTASKEASPIEKAPYPASQWQYPLLSMRALEERKEHHLALIDVREADRFNGVHEPIDLVAGHIPGAINVPYTQNLNADGTFKSPQELSALYAPWIDNGEEVVFYCGSGVTACHGILAMAYAFGQIAELYPGSWSEWSRNTH